MSKRYKHNFSRIDIIALWEFLKHGDQDHALWLLDRIEAFFEGNGRPVAR